MDNRAREITVLPGNIKISAEEGTNLHNILQKNGINFNNHCSGSAVCGKCAVRIVKGHSSISPGDEKFLSQEQLGKNYRLACGVYIYDDMVVAVPSHGQDIRAKEFMDYEPHVKLDCGIKKYFLTLNSPDSRDQRADTERIQGAYNNKIAFPLRVLRKIPRVLRNNDFKATITLNGDIALLDLEPGDRTSDCYGIAVDIGTTTVVVYLFNLCTGLEVFARSITNPQTVYGADVISRINYVQKNGESGLKELQERILVGLNSIIDEICIDKSISYKNLYKACVAGNPTMIQLFLGIDPCYIDKAPYIPVLRDVASFKAREIGLKINPEAPVQILPGVSAYVGSDITAGILATGLDRAKGVKMLIDIGTNGEIVIGNRNRILSCSAAAGPAFEGANIERGMRAQLGAIHRVDLNEKDISFETFGDGLPLGICGSGLIDLVAQLRNMELISKSGSFSTDLPVPIASRFEKNDKQNCFNIDGDIYLSQKDVRELQLAKGAIRAGIEILIKEYNISIDDIEQIYLAGAFGNFLRKESVTSIGLIPDIKLNKIKSVGNAAGHGVKLCLLNQNKLKHAQKIAEKVEYIELSYRTDFNDEFIKEMSFP